MSMSFISYSPTRSAFLASNRSARTSCDSSARSVTVSVLAAHLTIFCSDVSDMPSDLRDAEGRVSKGESRGEREGRAGTHMSRSQRYWLKPDLTRLSETSATCELSMACSFCERVPVRDARLVSACSCPAETRSEGKSGRTMPSSEQSKLASVTSSLTAAGRQGLRQRRSLTDSSLESCSQGDRPLGERESAAAPSRTCCRRRRRVSTARNADLARTTHCSCTIDEARRGETHLLEEVGFFEAGFLQVGRREGERGRGRGTGQ